MATKRARKKTVRQTTQQKSLWEFFRFGESYTSMVLGIVAVIIASILVIAFVRNQGSQTQQQPKQETSSTSTQEQSSQTLQNAQSSQYVIKAGDDLWKISEKYYQDGYKWVEIARANNLANPGVLHVGNTLKIPGSVAPIENQTTTEQKEQSSPPVSEAVGSTISGFTYTVEYGDGLWDIAVRAYGDGFKWVEIAKENNIQNPDIIHSGNVLKIPR